MAAADLQEMPVKRSFPRDVSGRDRNLVNTVVLMMNFSGGGNEGNWVLHILAAEAMPPYYRFPGCHNYAHYAAFYVNHMKGLIR